MTSQTCTSLTWLFVATILACGPTRSAMGELSLNLSFEGASADVLEIDQQRSLIRIAPAGNPDRGWACWWALRIDGAVPEQVITVEVEASDKPTRNNGRLTQGLLDAAWALPERASFSHDGKTWFHTLPGEREGRRMRYDVVAKHDQLWLAWGPPFTPQDTESVVMEALKQIPFSRRVEIATSRAGRSVAALSIASPLGKSKRPAIWVQARQHAWESGSSWVARGLIEWLGSDDTAAKRLIEIADLMIVPIMDVDNVASGNGGKEADPRDHNRDWAEQPVYPEVAAAQRYLLDWAEQERLALFVDLHNPAPQDKRPFFFCGPPELLSEVGLKNRSLFLTFALRHIRDPLRVEEKPRITGANYHPLWRQISGQWVNEHGNPDTVAVCLETAWNTPHSTTAGYRTVGRQLGASIENYLSQVASHAQQVPLSN